VINNKKISNEMRGRAFLKAYPWPKKRVFYQFSGTESKQFRSRILQVKKSYILNSLKATHVIHLILMWKSEEIYANIKAKIFPLFELLNC